MATAVSDRNSASLLHRKCNGEPCAQYAMQVTPKGSDQCRIGFTRLVHRSECLTSI